MKQRFYVLIMMLLVSGFLEVCAQDMAFPIYFESLKTGKKDTLWLGLDRDGPRNCDYDSLLCEPVRNPFRDTASHVGAYAVTGDPRNFDREYGSDDNNPPLECPVFLKKRYVPVYYSSYFGACIPVVFPASEAPVRLSWDSVLMSNPLIETPILTDYPLYCWWDVMRNEGCTYREVMYKRSSYVLGTEIDIDGEKNPKWDSEYPPFHVLIADSSGKEHVYLATIVSTCVNLRAGTEGISTEGRSQVVRITSNPVGNILEWSSTVEVKLWSVYDIMGRQMVSGRGDLQSVDAGTWPSGLYFFRWESKDGQRGSVRFVKG